MNLINLIKSKLEGTTAKIKYNGKLSEEFSLSHGLTQGGILSPCLFNFFMGAIMEEIRRRHAEIGAGISVRYNMNCNPLKRSDGKNEDISRGGKGE